MKQNLIIIGDRVLIAPDDEKEMTRSGLYLPQGVVDKNKVQSGKVIKVGPGSPVADPQDFHKEPWESQAAEPTPKYVPLQAREQDRAIFLRNAAIEIEYEQNKYLIVPQSAILALLRYERADDRA